MKLKKYLNVMLMFLMFALSMTAYTQTQFPLGENPYAGGNTKIVKMSVEQEPVFDLPPVADGVWSVDEGYSGTTLYITFNNIDSANGVTGQWTGKMAAMFGETVTMSKYYNAAAGDTFLVVIQARVQAKSNLIYNIDSLVVIGASSPAASSVNLTPSGYGDEYRIKVIVVSQGTANASTGDLELGFVANKPTYVPSGPKKNYMENYNF